MLHVERSDSFNCNRTVEEPDGSPPLDIVLLVELLDLPPGDYLAELRSKQS